MRHHGTSEHDQSTLGRTLVVAGLGLVLLAIGSVPQIAGASREHPVTRAAVSQRPVTGLSASPTAEPPEPTTSVVTTTTSVAPPEPTTTVAPVPERASMTEAPSAAASPTNRLRAAFERAVPADWRADIPVDLVATDGSTSWARASGTILVSAAHRNAGDAMLENVLAHEFGHLIAFRYGSGAYLGAGPEGWPAPSHRPEEVWAKCVAKVFTGDDDHSYGLPPCSGEQLSFAASWLAAGPVSHARA